MGRLRISRSHTDLSISPEDSEGIKIAKLQSKLFRKNLRKNHELKIVVRLQDALLHYATLENKIDAPKGQ